MRVKETTNLLHAQTCIRCYIGIFNKETNKLDLVPADYFHLRSSGPQKSTETYNETQLKHKLQKQDNLVGYYNIKRSMCSKFSTQKYARIQANIEQQRIKQSDIEGLFFSKFFEDSFLLFSFFSLQ